MLTRPAIENGLRDHDGIPDEVDTCPLTANHDQAKQAMLVPLQFRLGGVTSTPGAITRASTPSQRAKPSAAVRLSATTASAGPIR